MKVVNSFFSLYLQLSVCCLLNVGFCCIMYVHDVWAVLVLLEACLAQIERTFIGKNFAILYFLRFIKCDIE